MALGTNHFLRPYTLNIAIRVLKSGMIGMMMGADKLNSWVFITTFNGNKEMICSFFILLENRDESLPFLTN